MIAPEIYLSIPLFRTSKQVVLFVLAAAFFSGCSNPKEVNTDTSRDLETIDLIRERHVLGVNTTDVEMVLKDFSSDIIYLGPGLRPIEGKEALREFIAPLYEIILPRIEMTPRDINIKDDVAIEWGLINGTMGQVGSDSTQNIHFKYIFVYERSSGGEWLITRDIYNEIAD
ncbi:nuclear transport factor 2 family protein [Robiginitalea sp. SC105]|uniref:YybH family protein n=1 Tax=Robiginitalea sp. SC105 TaxID=2762332 RepID=UPI00163B1412|nr:nuclear transport factor 2 family protein [Robiginitalea sp. SC105]MBC2839859.1 nuclear transport factor 2 family protein [Robiginitalea sp. SC105]